MGNLEQIKRVYFLGIGGIGMSALARYFVHLGKEVYGYDRTETALTRQLQQEGVAVHYTDDPELIPESFRNLHRIPENLVVYTPAIPGDHREKAALQDMGYNLTKRAEVLGYLSAQYRCLAVAGSHGKSTVSALLTQILIESGEGCNAFLGAISKNLNSNFVASKHSIWSVMEADEFDRSFLKLKPWQTLVTSMDRDHLDIYHDEKDLLEAFTQFLNRAATGSTLILKRGLPLHPDPVLQHRILTYSLDDPSSDYYARVTEPRGLGYLFDLVTPTGSIEDVQTLIPGWINLENAVAAGAMALEAGFAPDAVRAGLAAFKGLNRRFDVQFNRSGKVYLDDYAHHPNEIMALVQSVKKMFPGKKITGIFQPHLFTRTRDLAADFAAALEMLDELVLLDIYPAREEPIPGVSADLISQLINRIPVHRQVKEQWESWLPGLSTDVLVTIGAGNIDQLVKPITQYLEDKVE